MLIKPRKSKLSICESIKFLLSLQLLAIASYAMATPPPFPGGVLYIQSDPQEIIGCSYNNKRAKYPPDSIQYYYDGKTMWQIKIHNYNPNFQRLPMPEHAWIGTEYMTQVANENQDHEYECVNRVEFNPKKVRDQKRALAMARINVGRLRKNGLIWYWGAGTH